MVQRMPRKVVWRKPLSSWYKLNVDRSYRKNSCSSGGGGIIRDSKGNMKDVFSEKLKPSTNNSAKLQVNISGI